MQEIIQQTGELRVLGVGLPTLGSDEADAIALGRAMTEDGEVVNRMRYGGERHVLVMGPNGSGKTMGLLVPNLLQCQNRSIFVIDPKGELAALTAPYRRTLGEVVIINPFGVLADRPGYEDLVSAGYNPLANLDHNARSFNSDAALLANALVKVESKDPHWDDSARALLAALIMFVTIEAREDGGVPTMARVRELLCRASGEGNPKKNIPPFGLPIIAEEMMRSAIAGLRNKASQFKDWTAEVRSIASAAKRQTEPFDDDEIADDVAKNGFDFREMKKRPVTVYVILPPEMMVRHAKWLRLLLTAAIQGVMRVRNPGEPKILFMLDEFAALGHLEIIETVWALVRGYGIQIMPVLQDLSQLKALYQERWETVLGMAGAIASFTPNDLTTARWISERLGETTRVVASYHQNFSHTQQGATASEGVNWTQTKVPLVSPHKLFGLPRNTMAVTLAGLSHFVPAYAPNWWEIRQCRERVTRLNPYFQD